MFIQTEETPNHNALKFLPGKEISSGGPVFYNNQAEVKDESLLALKLFQIDGVEAIFYGYDFITVTKKEDFSWETLKPEILMIIMDHFNAGLPVFDQTKYYSEINKENLSSAEKQIVEIIETRVRPSVAMDGGDIIYKGFNAKEGIVYLELRGACSGCPSSTITLKNGIESMLQHYVPEVIEVRATNAEHTIGG